MNMSRSVPEVLQGTATKLPWPDNYFDAVLTDPPYYINVPYADLSDFFYVWLKRTIRDLYHDLFARRSRQRAKRFARCSIGIANATRKRRKNGLRKC
jgi:putative DNA methylase